MSRYSIEVSIRQSPPQSAHLGDLSPTQLTSGLNIDPFRPIMVSPEIRRRGEERVVQIDFDVESVQTKPILVLCQTAEIERHLPTWGRYNTHLALENIVNYLEDRPHVRYQDATDAQADTLLQHVFEFVVDQSTEAANHDWNSGLEIEGRICGWDGMIKKILRSSHPGRNSELFSRFERKVHLSRNAAFDIASLASSSVEFTTLLKATDRLGASSRAFPQYEKQVEKAAAAINDHAWTIGDNTKTALIVENESSDPLVRTVAKAQYDFDRTKAIEIANAQATRLSSDLNRWASMCSSFAALASRVVEEPLAPICDVFAGIRIQGILRADTKEECDRNSAFNIIGAHQPRTNAPSTVSQIDDIYERQFAKAEAYPQSPFARDGVPDGKDVLELIRVHYEAERGGGGQPESAITFDPLDLANQVHQRLSAITASRKKSAWTASRVERKTTVPPSTPSVDHFIREPTPQDSISVHLQLVSGPKGMYETCLTLFMLNGGY
ncbi:hypothetical protein GGF50DRAFT_93207 [Schizophyllum commune]